jgi:hypothetical protein
VDLHGTVFKPSKKTQKCESWEKEITTKDSGAVPYRFAIETLRLISSHSNWKLILWTSTQQDHAQMYKALLADNLVTIHYINENPECKNNNYADFSEKFCFDLLIDDKAGFEPEDDWEKLYEFLTVGYKNYPPYYLDKMNWTNNEKSL